MRAKREIRASLGLSVVGNGHEPVGVYMRVSTRPGTSPVVFEYEPFGAISSANPGRRQSVSKEHMKTGLQVSPKTNKSNSRQKRVPKPEPPKIDLNQRIRFETANDWIAPRVARAPGVVFGYVSRRGTADSFRSDGGHRLPFLRWRYDSQTNLTETFNNSQRYTSSVLYKSVTAGK